MLNALIEHVSEAESDLYRLGYIIFESISALDDFVRNHPNLCSSGIRYIYSSFESTYVVVSRQILNAFRIGTTNLVYYRDLSSVVGRNFYYGNTNNTMSVTYAALAITASTAITVASPTLLNWILSNGISNRSIFVPATIMFGFAWLISECNKHIIGRVLVNPGINTGKQCVLEALTRLKNDNSEFLQGSNKNLFKEELLRAEEANYAIIWLITTRILPAAIQLVLYSYLTGRSGSSLKGLTVFLSGIVYGYCSLGTPTSNSLLRSHQDATNNYKKVLQENFSVIEELMLLNGNEAISEEILSALEQKNRCQESKSKSQQFNFIQSALVGAILLIVNILVNIDWNNIGSVQNRDNFLLITSYLRHFFTNMAGFHQIISDLKNEYLSLSKFMDSLNKLTGNPNQNERREISHKQPPVIRISGLSYHYPNGDSLALNEINLNIEIGKKIAIIGQIHSGKSTLLKIISHMITGYTGEIFFDNVSTKTIDRKSLSQTICLISQRSPILNKTIKENIIYGIMPSPSADSVMEAIQISGASRWINKLEKKAETLIGPGGIELSGGQQQQIFFARAIIRRTTHQIFMFDEPTSNMDAESASETIDSLFKHFKNKTVIFVTHRLTFMSRLDKIFVLDKGCLVEHGTHQHLLEKDGIYARIYKQDQSSEYRKNGNHFESSQHDKMSSNPHGFLTSKAKNTKQLEINSEEPSIQARNCHN